MHRTPPALVSQANHATSLRRPRILLAFACMAEPPMEPAGSGLRILVADDNPIN